MNLDLIVKIKFGSHLYGTNTPQSDTDYKSVYIPTAREIILQRVSAVHTYGKKKAEGERNSPDAIDNEIYSLQRYLNLLAEGQTVAIDMLFAPEPQINTWLWEHIQKNSERLLTKRSAAFVGYCRMQANKYGIKGSRVAAAKAAMEMFETNMGILGPQAKVGDLFVNGAEPANQHTSIVTKQTTKGYEETYYVCCDRMVGFKNTLKEAYIIYRRIHESYGNRARMAETNEGIDWKALSHAVRVGNEALELLDTHHIIFPLPNAAHILAIKQGTIPYKAVAEEIEILLDRVEAASKISTLRDDADYGFIDDLVYENYINVLGRPLWT